MNPALRDHCHESLSVFKDHIHVFLAEGPTFQCNRTCHQRPLVWRYHTYMASGVVFQDRFHCIGKYNSLTDRWSLNRGVLNHIHYCIMTDRTVIGSGLETQRGNLDLRIGKSVVNSVLLSS